ncbi:MAG: DUF3048 domain-containing protein [Patescibacteria group bacterium]
MKLSISNINIEKFLKRSWPMLIGGAVFVVGLAALLFYVAINGNVRSDATGADSGPAIVVATSTEGFVPRHLDGVLVPEGQEALQPIAIMVENSPDARPLSGVAEANLVVEAPVEGGITRFMLVFDATTTFAQVGPVRSARPYYVELADALHAVYAHVGGSPEGLDLISKISGFRNLDQFYNGPTFWRSSRSAPHNVYTKNDLVATAVARKGWQPQPFTPWRYVAELPTSTQNGLSISVPYGGAFNVSWTYDEASHRYLRRQAGVTERDLDGATVSSTNVLVLKTDAQQVDDYGRLHLRTTGSGKGVLFRDGERFDITWHRSGSGWFTFESIDAGDVFFKPGPTWISLVTTPDEFPASLESDGVVVP